MPGWLVMWIWIWAVAQAQGDATRCNARPAPVGPVFGAPNPPPLDVLCSHPIHQTIVEVDVVSVERQSADLGIATVLEAGDGLSSEWMFVVRATCDQPLETAERSATVVSWDELVEEVRACMSAPQLPVHQCG